MDLEKIYAPVKNEVKELEIKLEKLLKHTVLKDSFKGSFLLKGKKIRPVFLFLLSKALGYETDDIIDYGIIVELLHNASLVHDDIIDHSDKRRGLNTFNIIYDNNIAVLLGDYLFLLANKTALNKKNIDLLEALSHYNERLLLGEILEGFNSFNIDTTEEQYVNIIKDKTASLFELIAKITSILIKADNSLERELIKLGSLIGLSFQIIDDILDYRADKNRLGKPIMNDLREGTITLPLIFSIKQSTEIKNEVDKYFKTKDEKLLKNIKSMIEKSGGFDYSNRIVKTYISKAKEIVSGFNDSIYAKSLNELFDFILGRAF